MSGQDRQRDTFVADCHQKAWNSVCNADWLESEIANRMVEYGELSKRYGALKEEIDAHEKALDAHTYENRALRKELRTQLIGVGEKMEDIMKIVDEGNDAAQRLR